MTLHAWIAVLAMFFLLVAMAATRIPPDLAALAGLVFLLTTGTLDAKEAFSGFSNEGMLTVAVLFIVAAGLRETGCIGFVSQTLLGRPKTLLGAQLRLMVPTALLSAFVNNTPLVAILLPVVADWSKKFKLSPSKLMIPLSYSAILGGTMTLLGTSTNMVVNGLLTKQAGLPSLGLFELAWVGIPCCAVGLSYLMIFSRTLLPDRSAGMNELADPRQYTIEMMVEPGSPIVGQTVEQAGLRHLHGVFLIEIERGETLITAVGPQEKLYGGDRLVFAGIVESVVDLQKIRGLTPATNQVFKLDSPRSQRCLVEAVVSNQCPIVGQTIREGNFRSKYNAAVIAVAHHGERVRKKIGDIVLELEAGDVLLIETHPSFVEQHGNSRDFFLVRRVEDSTPPRHDRMWIALGIMIGMITLAGFEIVSMLNAALLAALAMLALRCCPIHIARKSMDWELLVVIAASFGIGRALEVTGAAKSIASALEPLAQGDPWISLAVIYGLTMIATEIVTNNAAAVLAFPIAMATAAHLDVNYKPFVIAVMIAASAGFSTPIGYQTNLMVMGPGGYRFSDYVKIGVPLNILMWVVTIALTPLIWPFKP